MVPIVLKKVSASWSARVASLSLLIAGLLLMTGCGAGAPSITRSTDPATASTTGATAGVLYGGANPISGATITLYFTGTTGYGLGATAVASTTTSSTGNFNLGNPSSSCPSGGYAYITAYQGSSGATGTNANILLMSPVGACSTYYTPTYTGPNIWIDEMTTAVSAYALGNFMTVGSNGSVSIGAPANNTATASAGTPGVAGTQSAAGLAHAFANALSIINSSTGQVNSYTHGGTSTSTGGVIPVAEVNLLGNILQGCVNSTGSTGTNTSTSNDGTVCGELFSLTTPPQSGANTPTNTLQAMLNLAKYPNPSVNTWNSTCTSAGAGTKTATSCLFALSPPVGAYAPALSSAPPDWSLAIIYSNGYGAVSPNPGIKYPVNLALDFQDNVYVLNWSDNENSGGHATSSTNIIGMKYDGTFMFSTTPDTTDLYVLTVGTDTAGHVFTANNLASTNNVLIYNTSSGALSQTINIGGGSFQARSVLADPFNSVYVGGGNTSTKIHQFTYDGSTFNTTANVLQLSSDTNGAFAMVMDQNYDIYELSQSGSDNVTFVQNGNSGSLTSTPTFASSGTTITSTFSGTTANGGGLAIHCPCLGSSTNSAYLFNGPTTQSSSAPYYGNATLITPNTTTNTIASGSSVSTLATAGVTSASPKYQYAAVDGNGWVYTVDGVYQVSGVTVYDTVDGLTFPLYKGCFVSTGTACAASGFAPVNQPTGLAIDSAGDVWVTSGDQTVTSTPTGFLTEFIGVAAPTWPGLSMAKFGLPN
jgi:hypothetical protein